MPKLFAGVKCLLVGMTAKQKKILTQNITTEGGTVINRNRPASLFGPQSLPDDVTHVLVENKTPTLASLTKALNCPQEDVLKFPILHIGWISHCIHEKKLDESDQFFVAIQDEGVSVGEAKVVEETAAVDQVFAAAPGVKRSRVESTISSSTSSTVSSASAAAGGGVDAGAIVPVSAGTSGIPATIRTAAGDGLPSIPPGFTDRVSMSRQDIDHSRIPCGEWTKIDSVMLKVNPTPRSSTPAEVLAFDMDGTIIATASGNVFAKNENDWRLWSGTVPTVLRQAVESGKRLLIISNQSGVGKKVTEAGLQRKVDAIIAALGPGVTMDFMCSIDKDLYRKPRTGMWDLYSDFILSQSGHRPRLLMYVGDAAGRPEGPGRKKDFSDTDLKFALNLFTETPEVFFLKSTLPVHVNPVCKGVILSSLISPIDHTGHIFSKCDPHAGEVVLLMAPPACGKSTLARRFEERGYVRVNQDTLKTVDKCLSYARSLLGGAGGGGAGGGAVKRKGAVAAAVSHVDGGSGVVSLVVDNTNVDASVRKAWITLAREAGVPIRCVCLDVNAELSSTLETLRLLDPTTLPADKRSIPGFVMSKMYKELKWPTTDDGFFRVDVVPYSFRPSSHPITLQLQHSYVE